jgi:hypothetical protein
MGQVAPDILELASEILSHCAGHPQLIVLVVFCLWS